eukprot:gene15297-21058_t
MRLPIGGRSYSDKAAERRGGMVGAPAPALRGGADAEPVAPRRRRQPRRGAAPAAKTLFWG